MPHAFYEQDEDTHVSQLSTPCTSTSHLNRSPRVASEVPPQASMVGAALIQPLELYPTARALTRNSEF